MYKYLLLVAIRIAHRYSACRGENERFRSSVLGYIYIQAAALGVVSCDVANHLEVHTSDIKHPLRKLDLLSRGSYEKVVLETSMCMLIVLYNVVLQCLLIYK